MNWSFVVSIAVVFCVFLSNCYAFTAQKRLQVGNIRMDKLKNMHLIKGGAVPLRDLSVSMLVVVETIAWLKAWSYLAKEGILDAKVTRKAIHTGSAPLFMAHWPLYSKSAHAKYFAAAVPCMQIIRLYLAGTSSQRNRNSSIEGSDNVSRNELVVAVSRTGDNREALGGPLIYSVVLFLGTALFFRGSPIGIVAVSQMAAGDGLADIVGRQFGSSKWPFSSSKSVLGSVAFVCGGFLVSYALLALMNETGVLPFDVRSKVWALLVVSVLSAAVELVPGVDDNISVPIFAAVASAILL